MIFLVNNNVVGSIPASGQILNYGKHLMIGKHGNGEQYLPGTIDEIRISNIARSNSWIATEYSNQNDPFNFLSFGPEEVAP